MKATLNKMNFKLISASSHHQNHIFHFFCLVSLQRKNKVQQTVTEKQIIQLLLFVYLLFRYTYVENIIENCGKVF
jgi:hypothetical protein